MQVHRKRVRGPVALALSSALCGLLLAGCSADPDVPVTTLDLKAGAPSTLPVPPLPTAGPAPSKNSPADTRTAKQWFEQVREHYETAGFCRIKGETELEDGSRIRLDAYASTTATTGLVWVGGGKLRVRRKGDRVLLRGDAKALTAATGIPLEVAKAATTKQWIEFDLDSPRLEGYFRLLVPEQDLGLVGAPVLAGTSAVNGEPVMVLRGREGGTRLLVGAIGEPVLRAVRFDGSRQPVDVTSCGHSQSVTLALPSRIVDGTY